MRSLQLVCLLQLLAVCTAASLTLPQAISSYMVLQRAPAHANLWGWATAGDEVTVTVDETSTTATVASDGTWLASLAPMAAGGPYDVVIETGAGDSITLTDVMFGDVYVCSGQSNMEFTVNMGFNASTEVADSVNYPNLRVFAIAEADSATPLDDVKSRGSLQWQQSSPKSVGDSGYFSYFSAVCYFFGRDIYTHLNGTVPIGLIDTSYGGTCIEPWSSPDVIKQCNSSTSAGCYNPQGMGHVRARLTPAARQLKRRMAAATGGVGAPTLWSSLYNAMMHPIINFPITGFTWYQGEANDEDAANYGCRFKAFIQDMRDKFNSPNMPFFYVELAPYSYIVPDIRAAQAAALTLPNVYRVVTIDIGDNNNNPYTEIHPRNKQTVGSRMSLAARYSIYNESTVVYKGPEAVTATVSTSGSTSKFDITFDSKTLAFVATADCTNCCKATDVFQVATSASGPWTNAASYALGTSGHVTVTANVASATYVRYAWTAWPNCVIEDSASGLVTGPFSSVAAARSSHIRRGRKLHH